MSAGELRRRFLVLKALRWLPTGLLMPVLVLLLLDRGLTLGQVGLGLGSQAIVVIVLELPTGGLADSHGRRSVLLAASAVDLISIGLLIVADTVPLVLGVFALQGIYRALESGPLDAWYVDLAREVDSETDLDTAMGASGAVTGISIATGSIGASVMAAVDIVPEINPLLVPVVVSMMFRAGEVVALSRLMTETFPRRSGQRSTVSRLIRDGLTTVRTSRALVLLLAIEALCGAGIVAFETFTPARLGAVLDDPADAAVVLGPATAAAWLLAGASSAAIPRFSRRVGAPLVGLSLRLVQGVTVVGIAAFTGPAGIIAAYLATMAVHGAANPVHQALVHRAVPDSTPRATVLSSNSLAGNIGFAGGAIGLGMLADTTTVSTAIVAGTALLVTAAPLYLRTATTGDEDINRHPALRT